MITFATKQPSNQDSTHQKPVRKAPKPIMRSLSTDLTGSAILQRKPGCACGGGCPRCQEQPLLQTKLRINEPGDQYEQEADRIADQVMRMPESSVQRQAELEEEEEIVQRKANTSSISSVRQGESEVPSIVHEVLRAPGMPLDFPTRQFMELRFGQDFSQVRVHTGQQAAASAQSVNARAYTVGQHLVFNAGQYTPGTSVGRSLLAHELTHVVQQRNQLLRVQRTPAMKTTCPTRNKDEVENSKKSRFRLEELSPEKEWLFYDFAVGSSEVDPAKGDAFTVVRPVERSIESGRLIVIYPIEDKQLQVLGYSDCHGSDDMNRNYRTLRAKNFCNAVRRDDPFESFFKHQILSCEAAPLSEFVASNATTEGRQKNRGVLIRVISKQPKTRFPYDPTYKPNSVNCATYLLSTKFFNKVYAKNAFCACTHTPDEPHNNCVRKCLQEKLRQFLAANARELEEGQVIWCPSIWKHHRECYDECGCDNRFIDFTAFGLMCTEKFTCPTVGLSIALFNNCMNPTK